jgi:hypothetical protein
MITKSKIRKIKKLIFDPVTCDIYLTVFIKFELIFYSIK